jgi:hypothetical protein
MRTLLSILLLVSGCAQGIEQNAYQEEAISPIKKPASNPGINMEMPKDTGQTVVDYVIYNVGNCEITVILLSDGTLFKDIHCPHGIFIPSKNLADPSPFDRNLR